jgi:gas vesicle protein
VDERSQVLLSALLGAVVGAVVGALYLTERGRRVRDQIDPALDGFMTELERARGTVEKAQAAAREGHRTFQGVVEATQTSDDEATGESTEVWPDRGVREVSAQ